MGVFMLDVMSPWEFRVKQLLPFAWNLPFHALTIPVDVFSVHSECLFQLFCLDWMHLVACVKFNTVRKLTLIQIQKSEIELIGM